MSETASCTKCNFMRRTDSAASCETHGGSGFKWKHRDKKPQRRTPKSHDGKTASEIFREAMLNLPNPVSGPFI